MPPFKHRRSSQASLHLANAQSGSAIPSANMHRAGCSRRLAGRSADSSCQLQYPPSGVLPYHGLALLAAPLCYLYRHPAGVYHMFRALYCRYWCRLHTLDGAPEGLLHLYTVFEALLQVRGQEEPTRANQCVCGCGFGRPPCQKCTHVEMWVRGGPVAASPEDLGPGAWCTKRALRGVTTYCSCMHVLLHCSYGPSTSLHPAATGSVHAYSQQLASGCWLRMGRPASKAVTQTINHPSSQPASHADTPPSRPASLRTC
jgi:hypothetical protein